MLDKLQEKLREREAEGLLRVRRVAHSACGPQGAFSAYGATARAMISFGSNDYLGLANDPRIAAAAQRGLERWGVGAGASHLVTGHARAHEELENALAGVLSGVASGENPRISTLTLSSGYLANLAILTALCNRTSIIFADKLNHACLNDGALLSRAQFKRFAHNDVSALKHLLSTYAANANITKLIAVDGVFSMDGDIAPLDEYLALAEEFDAWLLVDDAHAFGVLGDGRGTAAHFGLRSDRIITMGTLGKAAGVAGAFVAAHPSVIEWIINTAKPYIYTTAQPPMLAETTREALRIIASEPTLREKLQANVAQFRAGSAGLPWPLLPSETAIQPLIVGNNEDVLRVSRELETRGFLVPAIRPPTVPPGSARLRVSLSAAHTPAHIDALLRALHEVAGGQ